MPKNREVLMDEEKRSNQNYEIIESCTIGSTELVIGHNCCRKTTKSLMILRLSARTSTIFCCPIWKLQDLSISLRLRQTPSALWIPRCSVRKQGSGTNFRLTFAKGIAKGAVTYGLELMMALFKIVQGMISTIMNAAGFGSAQQTVLPQEIVTAVEDCGFFESIPLWAVTLIGGLFITVLSFIMIMSVYGRFFKLYIYTAIAPVPLSAFAGEPSQSVGKSFIKSYAAVCLEGAVIVLACIIFSLFASSPPVVNPDAAAVTMVWSYIGELVFNMLVLVGAVKMADRVVREMMGL